MTDERDLEVLPWLAQSIARAAEGERFVSHDRAVEVRGERAGQRIDDHLVAQRRCHHRNPLTQGLWMAEVACRLRVEVERGLPTAIDHAHRPIIQHALY